MGLSFKRKTHSIDLKIKIYIKRDKLTLTSWEWLCLVIHTEKLMLEVSGTRIPRNTFTNKLLTYLFSLKSYRPFYSVVFTRKSDSTFTWTKQEQRKLLWKRGEKVKKGRDQRPKVNIKRNFYYDGSKKLDFDRSLNTGLNSNRIVRITSRKVDIRHEPFLGSFEP